MKFRKSSQHRCAILTGWLHAVTNGGLRSHAARVSGLGRLALCVSIALAALLVQAPAQAQAQTQTETQNKVQLSFGTGFAVTDDGYFVTAHHVIRDKAQVLVGPVARNKWRVAQVVKVDPKRDLALLKARLPLPGLPLAEWRGVPIGLEALVIGYPQPRFQGLSKKITQGLVNGDRNEAGDEGYFQLSAEIQKGNSGGPVLAPDGSVIGVVRAKLNALSVAEKTKDLPQNVNFALKSAQLKHFLDEAGLTVQVREPDLQANSRPFEVFRATQESVVAVIGRNPKQTSQAGQRSPEQSSPSGEGATID
jgi:serine protease Do